ncbi:DUF6062 family protein [Cellulosilyticum sp. I15G10I2]|uniref:DUF6062 family protein n=1 Tax=Cellulosilyticum sp. I15G10I2 TaxID=1892843 RepID=UPI00085C5158|nr:DUF6062 family protein [Cellulosilyticum sp. I15G10I2]
MKDTIYTIPLTDAFKAEDECPFCFIKRKLEQDTLSFILGCAYMEDDIREKTDHMGFCKEHYKKMYEYGNRLGMALMLHTHYVQLQKGLKKKIATYAPSHSGFLSKFKKTRSLEEPSNSALSDWIKDQNKSCYVCDSIDKNFKRYMDTFFHLLTHSEDFKQLFMNCKGFCISHFGDILTLSDIKFSNKEKEVFYPILFNMMEENLKRIEKDISWFIDKYDYKNSNADWKTSKDAIPRGIQKLAGIYVQDPPFKEK